VLHTVDAVCHLLLINEYLYILTIYMEYILQTGDDSIFATGQYSQVRKVWIIWVRRLNAHTEAQASSVQITTSLREAL